MTRVRIATVDDVEALVRLRFDMDREQNGATLELGRFREVFVDWYADAGAHCIAFVAEAGAEGDREVVGTLWLSPVARIPRPSNLAPEPLGYVSFFFVDPDHRSQGVGRALLEAVTAYADEEQFDTLVVWPAERSSANYRELGFVEPVELLERLGPNERAEG